MGARVLYMASMLLLVAPSLAWADTKPADSLFVILYKQGPAWKVGVPMEQQDAMGAHYRYMKQLFDAGTIVDAGPTLDEPGGVVLLKATDLDAAKAIMQADPSITQQMFTGEVHSWKRTFRRMTSTTAAIAATTTTTSISAPACQDPCTVTRGAHGNTITSSADPAVQIDLPASASFVGNDTWMLAAYLDDISLYAYVDADQARAVQRLYWVQFEAYSPARPELHHIYDSTRHVSIGGLDFLVDTWAGYTDSKDEPDSDTAHLKAQLVKQGYALPRSMLTVRFVHLMDGARKELMLLYKEPAPDGLTADDLKQGGRAYDLWPELEKGLIVRGQQSFLVH
jgi:uncharacterized protein YciI